MRLFALCLSFNDFCREVEFTSVQIDTNCRYALWISFLEIYNERILDLLEDDIQKCKKDVKVEDKSTKIFHFLLPWQLKIREQPEEYS